jgi:hypothetical protein
MQEFENSPAPDHKQYVRKVVLPSGKTIEVISFEDLAPRETDIHVCPECASELVYPVSWEEADRSRWEVSLRCPNCEWHGTGIFQQELVERFDEELDRGTEALVRDLKRLMHANMEEEIDRFVEALDHDLILPEDF